jgi:hypothetical protein
MPEGKSYCGARLSAGLSNLSQFGVVRDSSTTTSTLLGRARLDPTTGEFGRANGFGDFEGHEKVATRLAVHYTRSDENRRSQPGTEAPENSQIRVSDGSIIFMPGLFGDGTLIGDARYRMTSFDAGVKYRGFALKGEYYWRVIDNFRGPGVEDLPFVELNDTGLQLQGSVMIHPKTVQLYLGGSKVRGVWRPLGLPSRRKLVSLEEYRGAHERRVPAAQPLPRRCLESSLSRRRQRFRAPEQLHCVSLRSSSSIVETLGYFGVNDPRLEESEQ